MSRNVALIHAARTEARHHYAAALDFRAMGEPAEARRRWRLALLETHTALVASGRG